MSRNNSARLVKEIIRDVDKTVDELYKKELIRDRNGIAHKKTGPNSYEISFSGKTPANSVMYDKHISVSYLMRQLLAEHQYSVLLYDKGIIQAEFCIDDGKIVKERLIFLKKHNRIWSKDEIANADLDGEDWFEEEDGISTLLRIDYDPSEHIECNHPVSHLTISNNETCRIPIQNAISFSEFTSFVLLHFYGEDINSVLFHLCQEPSITAAERKMFHISWNI